MYTTPFKLTVVTPVRTAIDETVTSVIVPVADGYLGILANHAPMMTVMRIGHLEYETVDGVREVAAVTNGFVEVADNKVTVLADAAEKHDEINVARAKQSLERAEKRLGEGRPDIDIERARAAYERAKNRLIIAQRTSQTMK
jgi:F-type H+-transporting ATPase subunit epsilon